MITFRKVAAASAGRLIRAYLTENRPEPYEDVRYEPGKRTDSVGRLTAYYTGRECRAHWRPDMPPAVAAALGLNPLALPKDLELDRLFEAKRADTGEAWSRARRVNSGFDFTFAPHKSVSLAIEFAETPAEAALLWAVLDRVNHRTMQMIARDIGWARKGHGGEDGADPGEVGWASFRHRQARPTLQIRDGKEGITYLSELPIPGDPHAHIHNALFNLVVTADGRVGSLDTQRLTEGRVLLYAAYAQALLAQELRNLGVRVGVDPSGRFAVLEAIPQEAVVLFSKGRRQTLRNARSFAERQGLDWDSLPADRKFGILNASAVSERQSKAGRSGAKQEGSTERQVWQEQAAAIDWQHRTVLQGATAPALTDAQRYDAAYAIAAKALAEEFRTAAVLERDTLVLWAARALIGVGIKGLEDIERVVGLLEERGIEIRSERAFLIAGMSDGRLRVTNTAQVRIEQRLADLAMAASRDRSGALGEQQIAATITASGLRLDDAHGQAQTAAIYALGQGSAASFLTGVAGAGKTTLLQPLVAAYRADTRYDPRGREVVGVATGWLQADALKGAGVGRTFAMEPLLQAIEVGQFQPTRNTVLICEELSQVAPRALLRLLELQAQTGFTLKGLGDREQCQAIEAGDSIEILNRVLPKADRPELVSTVRQKTERGRKVADLFRRGEAGEALMLKRQDGSARMLGGDQDQVVEQIADFFIRRRDVLLALGCPRGITASAPTNVDAAEISQAIRSRLKARGEIAAEEVVYRATSQNGYQYDLPMAVGDRLRLFRKTAARIIGRFGFIGSNGDVVTVEAISEQGLTVRNKEGRIGEIEWRRLKAPGSDRLLLGFGWCQTIDAVQGATSVEHVNALPRGTAGLAKFKGYTAESRAEWSTWTMISEAAMLEAVQQRRPLGDQTLITTEDLWQQAGKDMSRAPYKPLGMDLLNTLREDEAGAQTRLIAAHQRVEAQVAGGRRHGREHQARLGADQVRRALLAQGERVDATLRAATNSLASVTAALAGRSTLPPAARQELAPALKPRASSPSFSPGF